MMTTNEYRFLGLTPAGWDMLGLAATALPAAFAGFAAIYLMVVVL